MHAHARFPILALVLMVCLAAAIPAAIPVVNGGFEADAPTSGSIPGWQVINYNGALGQAVLDHGHVHDGKASVRLSSQSPLQANLWTCLQHTEAIPVKAQAQYRLSFQASGRGTGDCFIGVTFQPSDGQQRLYLPKGEFGWMPFALDFVTPPGTRSIGIIAGLDSVTDALWLDGFTLNPIQDTRSNLAAVWEPRPFNTVFPQSNPPSRKLAVLDTTSLTSGEVMLAATLEGLVNRQEPRIYLINNPEDREWLDWLIERGYTGPPEQVKDLAALLARFPDSFEGAILTDPALPGSTHAACMIGSVRDCVACSPELAERYGLKVVEDLRGRWTRNVDAYRYVWDTYWPKMYHHVLAVNYPLMERQYVRDYYTQNRIFTFWVSGYRDAEPGADIPAEMDFMQEVLARTPPNIPVMGWWSYGVEGKGVSESDGLIASAGYGKFIAGSEFCSNLSVHSGVTVPPEAFAQSAQSTAPMPDLDPGKLYLSLSVLDSGDAQWYWQTFQRKVWQDPARGKVPIGWCLNPTVLDTMPAVLEWYYRNATPNDAFFCAMSGTGYLNAAHYAERFRPEDRERVWAGMLADTRDYCKRLNLNMIELYTGGWGEKPPSADLYRRYFKAIPELTGILADFGRLDAFKGDNGTEMVDGKPVFHTLMRWKSWTTQPDFTERQAGEVDFALGEFHDNAPKARPALMSGLILSWTMFPSQALEVAQRLPADVQLVLPVQLPGLLRKIDAASKK